MGSFRQLFISNKAPRLPFHSKKPKQRRSWSLRQLFSRFKRLGSTAQTPNAVQAKIQMADDNPSHRAEAPEKPVAPLQAAHLKSNDTRMDKTTGSLDPSPIKQTAQASSAPTASFHVSRLSMDSLLQA